MDDAYYRKSKNYSYINMIRKKLKNLKVIKEPRSNICKPFYQELTNYLKKKYSKILIEKNYYKKNFKRNIFF